MTLLLISIYSGSSIGNFGEKTSVKSIYLLKTLVGASSIFN